MTRNLTLVLCSMLAFGALARDDYPMRGIAHNTVESSSIQYDCTLDGSELVCEMVQSFVRQELPAEKVAQRKKERLAQIKELMTNLPKSQCDELIRMEQVAGQVQSGAPSNQVTPEMRENFRKMPEAERKATIDGIRAASLACQKRDHASIDAMTDLEVNQEAGACRVGSNHWSERFQQTVNVSPKGERVISWTTKSAPSGPCGLVQLNRFEQEVTESGIKFWQYTARKAVTNPNGTTITGQKCSLYDETPYLYSWKSRNLFLGCNIIRFSPA